MAEDDTKEEPWEHDLEDPSLFIMRPLRMAATARRALYGIMAEFDNPSDLVAAARRTYEAGYRRINGYSPYPIEELSEAIGFTRTSLPLIVLVGGILGGLGGFFMQYWMEVIDYPLNVGGKPYNSWPAFIPITFEITVLVRRLRGGAGNAGAEQAAAALPSGIQCAEFCARDARSFLPGD